MSRLRCFSCWSLVAACSLMLAGCGDRVVEFDSNRVRAMSLSRSRDLPTDAAMRDVGVVLADLFGTPEEPKWPVELLSDQQAELVSLERLQQASGSVESDEANVHRGLYAEHCVMCHGVSGSGAGPASQFQWPYPRDFRAGVFKWKSTPRADKPTRNDLRDLLVRGIPGSPMPSFATVTSDDREALVDYLIYLSVRGEVERDLIAVAIDEMGYEDEAPEDELRLRVADSSGDESTEGSDVVAEVLSDIVDEWIDAEASPVPMDPVAGEADEMHASIARGAALFAGQVANCAGCHGPEGTGGMPLTDYDDWTKDFTTRIGITPFNREAVKPFRKAGALPPRTIEPRRLAGGVLRGGSDPETIYRRIQHGIAGTPMPGVELNDSADGSISLSPGDAWDLVHYVQSLVGESNWNSGETL